MDRACKDNVECKNQEIKCTRYFISFTQSQEHAKLINGRKSRPQLALGDNYWEWVGGGFWEAW